MQGYVTPDDKVDEAAPGAWWQRPRGYLDVALLFSFVILFGLAGWFFFEVRGNGAAAQGTAPLLAANPALDLKREAGRLWAAGERGQALVLWQEAHRLSPDTPDITESLARAQVGVAADELRAGRADAALPHLEAAYQLAPDQPAVLHEYQALLAYIAGRDAVAARQWERASEALTPLFRLDSGYLDVHDLLEQAMAGQQESLAAQHAQAAQAASQARQSVPGQRTAALLNPPEISNLPGQSETPLLGLLTGKSNKHIVVSINAQRMYVYENGQLIWDWVASTGEDARPTVPGRYRIQSKIENARSNVWSLWMPYWQGIYWAGSVENGIHGQVTFDSGGRLWEGYLGTRITFGCVMISDEHAALLFDWTDIGTPVSILWEWDPAWVPDENGDPL